MPPLILNFYQQKLQLCTKALCLPCSTAEYHLCMGRQYEEDTMAAHDLGATQLQSS